MLGWKRTGNKIMARQEDKDTFLVVNMLRINRKTVFKKRKVIIIIPIKLIV